LLKRLKSKPFQQKRELSLKPRERPMLKKPKAMISTRRKISKTR